MTISPPTKTSAWLLERAAQGELDAAETEHLRTRLAAEGRSLELELAALARSNREILADHPREAMAAAIRARAAGVAASSRTRRWSLTSWASRNSWIAPLALAGSVGIALLVVRGGHPVTSSSSPSPSPASSTVQQPDDEPTRNKGDLPRASSPRLLVYRQRAGTGAGVAAGEGDARPERLADGARVAHGDLLQLAYAAAREDRYGVLLSLDGAGRVTQHLPDEGASTSAPLRTAPEIRLPSAYELDDAPGFERFVLVTAARPFPVAVALDAARTLAADRARARSLPLALAPSFHQTSVLLRKTSKGTP